MFYCVYLYKYPIVYAVIAYICIRIVNICIYTHILLHIYSLSYICMWVYTQPTTCLYTWRWTC